MPVQRIALGAFQTHCSKSFAAVIQSTLHIMPLLHNAEAIAAAMQVKVACRLVACESADRCTRHAAAEQGLLCNTSHGWKSPQPRLLLGFVSCQWGCCLQSIGMVSMPIACMPHVCNLSQLTATPEPETELSFSAASCLNLYWPRADTCQSNTFTDTSLRPAVLLPIQFSFWESASCQQHAHLDAAYDKQ